MWPEVTFAWYIKRDFAGGPQNQKMTMQDNMSSQLVSIDKVQNRGHLDDQNRPTPGLRPSVRIRWAS